MKNKTQRLVLSALLAAVSLVIFMVELQIPPLTPIPGIKLGLSNVITLFVLSLKSSAIRDAAIILFIRILLSALIIGQPMMLFYSITGGGFAMIGMFLASRLFNNIPIISVTGAVFHNIAQILTACFIFGSASVLFYLPVLILSGILSGILTGFSVFYLYKSHPRFINLFKIFY